METTGWGKSPIHAHRLWEWWSAARHQEGKSRQASQHQGDLGSTLKEEQVSSRWPGWVRVTPSAKPCGKRARSWRTGHAVCQGKGGRREWGWQPGSWAEGVGLMLEDSWSLSHNPSADHHLASGWGRHRETRQEATPWELGPVAVTLSSTQQGGKESSSSLGDRSRLRPGGGP